MNKSLVICLLFCFATACQKRAAQGINLDGIQRGEELRQYETCIIIPRSGCAGCISNAMGFVVANIDSLDETLIIFTGIEDFKLLKLRVGTNVLTKKNVLVDSTEAIANNIIYPQLIHLTEGKIMRTEKFVPSAHNSSH